MLGIGCPARQRVQHTNIMTIRSLTLLGLITDKMLHDALGVEDAKLVEVLERKGILTRQEVLAMIQEVRQREPTGRPPRRFEM